MTNYCSTRYARASRCSTTRTCTEGGRCVIHNTFVPLMGRYSNLEVVGLIEAVAWLR